MTSDDWFRVGAVLGVGGLIVELIRGFFHRRKMGADYAEVISRSAVGLLGPLEKRVHDLEDALASSETRADHLADQLTQSEERARTLSRLLERATEETRTLRKQLADQTNT